MKKRLSMVLLAVQFILSGCASYVELHVRSLHELPSAGSGLTYKLLPSEGQVDPVNHMTYVKRISEELDMQGYVLEKNRTDPDYLVVLSYGISGDNTIPGSTTMCGQISKDNSHPENLGKCNMFLNLKIMDRRSAVVYEGMVQSSGTSADLAVIMPYMMETLFKDFPGNSGQVRMVKMKMPE